MKVQEKETLYEDLLVEFVNAPTTLESCNIIYKGFRDIFKFSYEFPEKAILNFSVREFITRKKLGKSEKYLFNLLMCEFYALRLLDQEARKSSPACMVLGNDRKKQSIILAKINQIDQSRFEHFFNKKYFPEREYTVGENLIVKYEDLLDSYGKIRKVKRLANLILEMQGSILKHRYSYLMKMLDEYIHLLDGYRRILFFRKEMNTLFRELIDNKNLSDSDILKGLIDYYNVFNDVFWFQTEKRINENELITEEIKLNEESCVKTAYWLDHEEGWEYTFIINFIVYLIIKLLQSDRFKTVLHKCQRCNKFFIPNRIDPRRRFCDDCSPKSKMTKEERRKYQRVYRQKKRQEKLSLEREARIKNLIRKTGYSREEVIEIIEADSKM